MPVDIFSLKREVLGFEFDWGQQKTQEKKNNVLFAQFDLEQHWV
jgi:hypothetical protein